MIRNRFLPAAFAAVALFGAGAMIATAQESTTTEATEAAPKQAPATRADYRGDRYRHHGGFDGRGGSEMFGMLFGQIDADDDGSVTQEEVDAFRAAKIGEVDASGDGALSIEEFDTLYREFTRSRMVDAFQDMDADGDGVISVEEMDQRFGDVVDRMDRDGDGALTLQPRGRRE